MIRIVVISDTHGQEYNVKIPKCDIFIHCGDSYIDSMLRLHMVNDWLKTIDAKHKIIIAGNHDTYLQELGYDLCKQLFTNGIYLQNTTIEIDGLKIWGSPHTPAFMSWAFMYPRKSIKAKQIWKQIPKNLDILITHGMPYQILDYSKYQKEHAGCKILQREVFKKKPKYYFGGHIHEAHGHVKKEGIKFYNVSVLDGDYKLVYKPTIIYI